MELSERPGERWVQLSRAAQLSNDTVFPADIVDARSEGILHALDEADVVAAVAEGTRRTALSTACSTGAPAAETLTGSIAVISCGGCAYSEKSRNSQGADTVAVVVVNNVAGVPTPMAGDGTANQPAVTAAPAGVARPSALQRRGQGRGCRALGGARL